jgi:hypothetical protein
MGASSALPFLTFLVICHLKLGINDNFLEMLATAIEVISSNMRVVTKILTRNTYTLRLRSSFPLLILGYVLCQAIPIEVSRTECYKERRAL